MGNKMVFVHLPAPERIQKGLVKFIPQAKETLFDKLRKLKSSDKGEYEIDIISTLEDDMNELAKQISTLFNDAPIYTSHCFNQANDGNKTPLSSKVITIDERRKQQYPASQAVGKIIVVICRTKNSFLLPVYISVTRFEKSYATYPLSPMGFWVLDDDSGEITTTDYMASGIDAL